MNGIANRRVHSRLRAASHHLHVAINHQAMLSQLMQATLTRDTYATILQAYRAFYAQIEALVDDYLASHVMGFDYSPRRKLGWLEADLAALDVLPAPLAPSRAGSGKLQHLGQLIGTLYVIEGSTLGARVISRELERNLGVRASNGGRFFAAYQGQTQAMWEDFLGFAETIADDEDECVRAEVHACDTFAQLMRVLDEYS